MGSEQCDVTGALTPFLHELLGFIAYVALFGFSTAASALSLYFLIKSWKNKIPHYIITLFSVAITSLNIIALIFKSISLKLHIISVQCYRAPQSEVDIPFQLGLTSNLSGYVVLSVILLPIFFWLSDAFLLYRAWVIWLHLRSYLLFPAIVYLASIVTGVIWMKQTLSAYQNHPVPVFRDLGHLDYAVYQWRPATAFSFGMDLITTSMISGRLIFCHRRQVKILHGTGNNPPYLSIVMVFIESAALSAISKLVQLVGPTYTITWNPIAIPICTFATNLIVLRKALGANVAEKLSAQKISIIPIRGGQPNSTTFGSIPGGFEAQLIGALGDPVVDIKINAEVRCHSSAERKEDNLCKKELCG